MALNLPFEFSYREEPRVSVRLRHRLIQVDTWATVDTGAAISVLDAELTQALELPSTPDRRASVVGISGRFQHLSFWRISVTVLPEEFDLRANLFVGFHAGLAKSTGNLLGRDFLESCHFGLVQRERRLYLGAAR